MVVVTKNRFVGFLKGLLQFSLFVAALCAVVLLYLHFFSDWKVYDNKIMGIRFSYPRELTLVENRNKITLLHQIPYQNNGGCDMIGDEKIYQSLTDFEMSFEIGSLKEKPNVVDGNYSAGILNGEYEYYGAEGCGDTNYYFPLSDRQLIVRRANIQILSGVRNNIEEREEILNIPGAISKERNDELFRQILSSFKVIK